MITEHAIDALDEVFRELRTTYKDRTVTLREALESMTEEELRQWLIKFIYASNLVVQSRL